jgi:hypothetical protein
MKGNGPAKSDEILTNGSPDTYRLDRNGRQFVETILGPYVATRQDTINASMLRETYLTRCSNQNL